MGNKSSDTKAGTGLRRPLGRTTAMLLTAAMIIGTGLFAALGEAAEKAGSGLLLAIGLSGLVALATGLSAASVGINFPEEGGGFTWSRKFGYPTLGFVAGCAYLGKGIVSTVVIALAFALYTAQMLHGLPPYIVHIIAAGAVAVVAGVNFLGVQLSARLLIGLLIVQLAMLAVFVGFAAPAADWSNLLPVTGRGWSGVLAGAAVFFWSWDGFMRMAIMASEVKDPRHTIPFAVVGGVALSAVVFLVVPAVMLGVLGTPAPQTGSAANDTPLVTVAAKAIGAWGVWLVLATAWLDTLTEAAGDLMTVTRVALAMGEAKELPAWLGAVHERSKIPRHAVFALGILCSALALTFDLRPVLEVANVFTLSWYSIVLFDALNLPKDKRLIWPVVSWLGLAGCMALYVSLPLWALTVGFGTLVVLLGVRHIVAVARRTR